MQEDHQRLLQEKAENKQLIELLEVQKNVLSKTVSIMFGLLKKY